MHIFNVKQHGEVCTGRRRFIAGLANGALVLFAAVPFGAAAHGDVSPLRGGIVAWAGELSLELVLSQDQTVVYVDDHGVPAEIDGIEATISVSVPGMPSSENMPMTHRSANVLAAPAISIVPGTRVSVILKLSNGQVTLARFVLR